MKNKCLSGILVVLACALIPGALSAADFAQLDAAIDEASSVTLKRDPHAPVALPDAEGESHSSKGGGGISVRTYSIRKYYAPSSPAPAPKTIQLVSPPHNSTYTPGVISFQWKVAEVKSKKKKKRPHTVFVLEKVSINKTVKQPVSMDHLAIDLKGGTYRWQVVSDNPKMNSRWRTFKVIDMKSKSLSNLYDGRTPAPKRGSPDRRRGRPDNLPELGALSDRGDLENPPTTLAQQPEEPEGPPVPEAPEQFNAQPEPEAPPAPPKKVVQQPVIKAPPKVAWPPPRPEKVARKPEPKQKRRVVARQPEPEDTRPAPSRAQESKRTRVAQQPTGLDFTEEEMKGEAPPPPNFPPAAPEAPATRTPPRRVPARVAVQPAAPTQRAPARVPPPAPAAKAQPPKRKPVPAVKPQPSKPPTADDKRREIDSLSF